MSVKYFSGVCHASYAVEERVPDENDDRCITLPGCRGNIAPFKINNQPIISVDT